MKKTIQFTLMIAAVLVLAFGITTPAFAQSGTNGDQAVFGGTYTLKSGDTLNGDLAVFGGTATIEKGARVNGNIVLSGGSLDINGEVSGSIIGVGGFIKLGEDALVHGYLYTIGGTVNQAPGADVQGDIIAGTPGEVSLPIPTGNWLHTIRMFLEPVGALLWGVFLSLSLAVLAVLIVLLLGGPTGNVAQTIADAPFISGGLGLLTLIVAPALFLLLAITLILSPLALLGVLILFLSILFGWIALGTEVGRRMASLFKVNWSLPVSAGLGTLVTTAICALVCWIPCINFLVPFALSMAGLGAVILSKFGAAPYKPAPRRPALVPATPVPPSAPVAPSATPAPLPPAAPKPAPQPPAPVAPTAPAAPPAPPAAPAKPAPAPKPAPRKMALKPAPVAPESSEPIPPEIPPATPARAPKPAKPKTRMIDESALAEPKKK